MKLAKLLSFVILGIFFISFSSAILVYGDWEDGNQSISVTKGEKISFNADFGTTRPSMTIDITVLDSQYNLVKYIEKDFVSNENVYFETYNIDTSSYLVGKYSIVLSGEDERPDTDTHTLYFTVEEIPDTNIPVITLLGESYVEVVQGESYVDAGATAYDVEDGDLTSEIVVSNPVNTNVLGTYYVRYNVEDSYGNHANEVIRTVKVLGSGNDTTAPIITVVVPQPSTYNFDKFVFEVLVNEESSVMFNLNDEGNISMTEVSPNEFKGMLLTLLEGEHSVTFYATDLSGNVGKETVEFNVNLNESFEFVLNVIVPKQGVEYDEEITFKVETNAVSEVVFSLNGEPNVTMEYKGSKNGILTFIYEDMIPEGDHEVIFYAEDTLGKVYSKKVSFSTDDGNGKKKEKKDIDDNFYERKYWDQFDQVNTPIYLNEDVGGEDLTLCQKFLAWFKKTFGFEFFYFMFFLFLLLVVLILIYILKKYREYYL